MMSRKGLPIWETYPRIYKMLQKFGHTNIRSIALMMDAANGDKQAMRWIRIVRNGPIQRRQAGIARMAELWSQFTSKQRADCPRMFRTVGDVQDWIDQLVTSELLRLFNPGPVNDGNSSLLNKR